MTPSPAPHRLTETPQPLTRPLALAGGHAYAALWPYSRPAQPASPDTDSPPDTQSLLILRDDGLAFGLGGDQPLSQLGLRPRFPLIPPAERLLSSQALAAYRQGRRPDPAHVFQRLVAVFDHFVDLDLSLGPPPLIAELLAAYTLTTWLADAFPVLGLLWITSDHPVGPDSLLRLTARLGHLGLVAPLGRVTATLRDFAAYGALLAFDDLDLPPAPATASNSRSWLVGSTRRGASALVRDYDPARRQWSLTARSAFCPRLVASTRLPDSRVAPDCLILPLAAPDPSPRLLRQPHDPAAWPLDPAHLQDDLWALALASLPLLPTYDLRAALETSLPPAALGPWRALLAVALWLGERGVPGLFDRLHALARDYQSQRPYLQGSDLTHLVLRAVMDRCAAYAAYAAYATSIQGMSPAWNFSTRDIISTAQLIHDPVLDVPRDWLTEHRVGRLLSRLCGARPPRPSTRPQVRLWRISLRDLQRWSAAYGLPLPESLLALSSAPNPDPPAPAAHDQPASQP